MDSVADITTGQWAGGHRFIPSSETSRLALGPIHFHVRLVPGSIYSALPSVDRSPVYNAEIKNNLNRTSTFTSAAMTCRRAGLLYMTVSLICFESTQMGNDFSDRFVPSVDTYVGVETNAN